MRSAKEYMSYPSEVKTKGNLTEEVIVGSDVHGTVVEDLSQLLKKGDAILKAWTAEDLSFIPDKAVDAVITDPPYYDNVMYSEISDFFYIWQRLTLREKYDCYGSEYSPRSREIIKNIVQGKDDEFFIKGLTRAFKECNRVLKDDGLIVFTFHHERSRAWASTLRAILEAHEPGWPHLYITAIYPVRSEGRVGVHGGGIRYDIIIVCKKTLEEPEKISWNSLKDMIHDRAREVLKRLWLSSRDLSDEDMFVVTMGKCLELYSKHYPNVFKNGRRVEVEEAVDDVDDIIDSLLKVKEVEELPSDVDEVTRLYCSYVVGLGEYLSYDSLHKRLSKGGMDVDVFIRERLVEKVREKVKVLKPMERGQYIEDKLRRGLSLLTIDRVHILYNVDSEGKPLLKYVAEYGGEDVRKVAELLFKKTGEESYARIAGIKLTTLKGKPKQKPLDEFAVRGSEEP